MSNERQREEEGEAILFSESEALAPPKANADFNRQTLNLWVSGRDFEPLSRQIRRRLGWMALPFAAGFLLMAAVLPHLMRSEVTKAPLSGTMPTAHWNPPPLPASIPSPLLRPAEVKPAMQHKEARHDR